MLNVKKINYNEDFIYGCETCDYGSSYVNEIEIVLQDNTYANIKVDKMYEYALSESDYMQIIANSDDIKDLILNIIKKLKENRYDGNVSWLINLQDLTIQFNGKDIDILKSLEKNKIIKITD